MKALIIKLAITTLLNALLGQMSIKRLLEAVGCADSVHDNAFKKRGFVLNAIKENEGHQGSTLVRNLVLELGVYLYKSYHRK